MGCALLAHSSLASAAVSRLDFLEFLKTAQSSFQSLAQQNGEKLYVVGDFDDPWMNAWSRREEGGVQVILYGGMARQPESSLDLLAMVFCHELGHAYGGMPYRDEWNRISIEGQADYWGARSCIGRFIDVLHPGGDQPEGAPQFVLQKCGSDARCARSLLAARDLALLLARNNGQSAPDFTTPDPTEVSQTVMDHPARVQCRLDTFLAGYFELPRPRCWYSGSRAYSGSRPRERPPARLASCF